MRIVHGLILVFLFYFFPNIFGLDNSGLDMNNYGPYSLIYEKIATCKGSKPPCGNVDILNASNSSNIVFTMNIHRECVLGMVRISMSAIPRNGPKNKKHIINYNIDKPCQHFVSGPVLRQAYGDEVMRKCILPYGNYTRQLDLKGLSEKFLGPKFFYGTYKFKVNINNKKYHVFCYENYLVINPIN